MSAWFLDSELSTYYSGIQLTIVAVTVILTYFNSFKILYSDRFAKRGLTQNFTFHSLPQLDGCNYRLTVHTGCMYTNAKNSLPYFSNLSGIHECLSGL